LKNLLPIILIAALTACSSSGTDEPIDTTSNDFFFMQSTLLPDPFTNALSQGRFTIINRAAFTIRVQCDITVEHALSTPVFENIDFIIGDVRKEIDDLDSDTFMVDVGEGVEIRQASWICEYVNPNTSMLELFTGQRVSPR